MNKRQALDFLELPESATDHDIQQRLSDKYTYFSRLSENAPNDFLKKVHRQNLEKINDIKSILLQETAPSKSGQYSAAPSGVHGIVQQPVTPPPSTAAVAFLIRHTENRSAKTFPLYLGYNFIGRSPQGTKNLVVIDDDSYISRQHAIIEVVNGRQLELYISDDQTQGKPSKNGTYINANENRITKRLQLKENDTIQIGTTKLILRFNNTSINKIVHEVEESEFMKTVVIDIF